MESHHSEFASFASKLKIKFEIWIHTHVSISSR